MEGLYPILAMPFDQNGKIDLEDLENEVMEELDGNPMKAYKIQFPYSVTFSLSDDDHHTQVIINTTSQEVTFARSAQDALYQKEKNGMREGK